MSSRILVVTQDTATVARLSSALVKTGFTVSVLRDPAEAVTRAGADRPLVTVVDERTSRYGTTELLRALRAASVPCAVVLLTEQNDPCVLLRLLCAGAWEIVPASLPSPEVDRILELARDTERRTANPSEADHRLERTLDFARAQRLSATLTVSFETPFEGKAVFVDGGLREASYVGLEGQAALREMLSSDDHWKLEPTPTSSDDCWKLTPEAIDPQGYVPSVLLVQSDHRARAILAEHLRWARLAVHEAADAEQAASTLREIPIDLAIVTDGATRAGLELEPRAREIRIVEFSSAGETHSEEALVSHCIALVGPRVSAYHDLEDSKEPIGLDLELLGPHWVLRTLATLRATGTLTAKDERAHYEIAFVAGALVRAVALSRRRQIDGVAALAAVLISPRLLGEFRPASDSEAPTLPGESKVDLIAQAWAALDELSALVAIGFPWALHDDNEAGSSTNPPAEFSPESRSTTRH